MTFSGDDNRTFGRPWIKTQGLLGSTVIYDAGYQFRWATPVEAHLNKRVEELERRVASLESLRRKPKRKAYRR